MGIFVTVGAQMPFDRMIRAVDSWGKERGRDDVFAQIGSTNYRPAHIGWTEFLEPEQFRIHVAEADVLVAHAGMGSILMALEAGKPILVMPRRGALHETRNDHQVATAERFREMGKVHVAMDEHELPRRLDELSAVPPAERISRTASEPLIKAIRDFVNT